VKKDMETKMKVRKRKRLKSLTGMKKKEIKLKFVKGTKRRNYVKYVFSVI